MPYGSDMSKMTPLLAKEMLAALIRERSQVQPLVQLAVKIEDVEALAEAYLDIIGKLQDMSDRLDDCESELEEAHTQMISVEDEVAELRADLRAATGTR